MQGVSFRKMHHMMMHFDLFPCISIYFLHNRKYRLYLNHLRLDESIIFNKSKDVEVKNTQQSKLTRKDYNGDYIHR